MLKVKLFIFHKYLEFDRKKKEFALYLAVAGVDGGYDWLGDK
jgi:hypothetical protein